MSVPIAILLVILKKLATSTISKISESENLFFDNNSLSSLSSLSGASVSFAEKSYINF